MLVCAAGELCKRRTPGGLHQRAVAFYGLRLTAFDRENAESKSVCAYGGNLHFHVVASDLKILLLRVTAGRPKEACGANGAGTFQNVAAIVAVGHLFQYPEDDEDQALPTEKQGRDYTQKYGC